MRALYDALYDNLSYFDNGSFLDQYVIHDSSHCSGHCFDHCRRVVFHNRLVFHNCMYVSVGTNTVSDDFRCMLYSTVPAIVRTTSMASNRFL